MLNFLQKEFCHRIFLIKIVVAVIVFNSVSIQLLFSQSAGSGDLATIESKADQIVANDNKVSLLNQQYIKTYTLEQEKLASLKNELSTLYDEMAVSLEELRQGRFCNGCDRTASELKRNGVSDVEQHFAENGGTHPAPPEKITKKENEYNALIAEKEKEVKNFEFSENEFTRKRADISIQMNDLKNINDRLRQEIVELSNWYKDKVVGEGKSKIKPFIDDLMSLTAQQHVLEDRIDIIITRLNDLDNEEVLAMTKLKEKVRLKNEEDKQNLQNRIEQLKTDLINLEKVYYQRKSEIQSQINDILTEIHNIENTLKTGTNLLFVEKTELENKKTELEGRLDARNKEMADLNSKYTEDNTRINNDIKKFNDDIWNLTINLSKRQEDASEDLKNSFILKRDILNQAKAAREINLTTTGDLLLDKMDAYDSKMQEYANILEKERNRLVAACNKAGCGCYGYDSKSDVMGNWSKAKGCVDEMNSKKHLDVYYGCEEESAIYESYYRSFQAGMSEEDLAALKRSTNHTRYDYILKKIN
jgi:hypothetical protein